ncbi:UDP-glycosyltransferase UGT5-like [Oratosquilla oratoria]|uniref:UDP-glycosyltransferase UGT5-like n=1 Tax=Oratosquilla oratoria TaxID=337810 RepID=UPI003F772934
MSLSANVLVVLGILAVAPLCLSDLPPPDDTFNILMLLPVASKSHRNLFLPLAKGLADRGHKITILSNLPPAMNHVNVQEIQHSVYSHDHMSPFELRGREMKTFSALAEILSEVARKLYTEPVVRDVYNRRKEFDVIIINHLMNEVAYPFLHEMPFIGIVPPGMDSSLSSVLGNVPNPAYVSSIYKSFPHPFGFIARSLNTVLHLALGVTWRFVIFSKIQREITSQFPDLPPLIDIQRNMSLAFLNSDLSDDVMPLLPSQVQIGGIHCRPGQPLPEDLSSWIEGAGDAGVVYFSLGSVAKSTAMPSQYRDLFVAAFAKLPQRVVWKFEAEDVPGGVSDNVLLSKWLPQQDILADPRVKVFISHGGLLSMQESLYHGTPLLALPIFADQPKNGDKIRINGYGITLIWEELTVDLIVDSIRALIEQPKYAREMAGVSRVLRDQMESPLDRAVWWTEYAVRHKGADALRSPAADLSWIEYFLLDVIYLFIAALVLFLWIAYKLSVKVKALLSKKSKNKED